MLVRARQVGMTFQTLRFRDTVRTTPIPGAFELRRQLRVVPRANGIRNPVRAKDNRPFDARQLREPPVFDGLTYGPRRGATGSKRDEADEEDQRPR